MKNENNKISGREIDLDKVDNKIPVNSKPSFLQSLRALSIIEVIEIVCFSIVAVSVLIGIIVSFAKTCLCGEP